MSKEMKIGWGITLISWTMVVALTILTVLGVAISELFYLPLVFASGFGLGMMIGAASAEGKR